MYFVNRMAERSIIDASIIEITNLCHSSPRYLKSRVAPNVYGPSGRGTIALRIRSSLSPNDAHKHNNTVTDNESRINRPEFLENKGIVSIAARGYILSTVATNADRIPGKDDLSL